MGLFKMNPREVGSDFIANLPAITVVALDDLVSVGILKRVKEGFYVLVQPLNQLNQTVVVSPVTALMVADIVNGWTEKSGEQRDNGYVVNKLSVTDRDLQSLCTICHALLSFDDEPGGEN